MGGRGEGKKTELFSCFFYIKGKRSKSGHPRIPYKNKKVERLKNEEKESKIMDDLCVLDPFPPSNRAEPPLQEGGNPFHRSYLIELKKKTLSL